MAKKKKEDIENDDEINQDAQDDFNEADDNFGLPDVDYEPIEREEESDSGFSEEQSEEEPAEEEHDIYASVDTSQSSGDSDESKKEYVPGSYSPPKDESIAPKVILLILVLLAVGAVVWWFGFEAPKREAAEKARIEKQKEEEARKRQQAEAEAERKRQAELAAQREAEARAAAEAKPKVGTIETISQRSGRYYVVISSALDGDLAMDYAEKKKKEGVSTYILKPFGKSKFHRIAVSDFGTWNEAQSEANDLKSEYGDGVWVIKY